MNDKVDIKIQDEDEKEAEPLYETKNGEPEKSGEPGDMAAPDQTDAASRLEAAEKQSRDYYDRLLRLSAEFDNYKKRTTREMRDIVKYANEKVLRELLTVVDNLERAVEAASGDGAEDDAVLRGVTLTLNETLKLLERHTVVPIKAMGEPFDPVYHQAMMQEEDDEKPENTVIRELQRGYLLHERLLRPAMVGVSKKKGVENNKDQTD